MAAAVAIRDAALAGSPVAWSVTCCGSQFSNFCDIGGDACDQFGGGAEGLQRPDFGQQINGQSGAVEISAEAIEVDFDFFALFAEGWIRSDADSSGEGVPLNVGCPGIHAVCGEQGMDFGEVRRGKTDGSSALGTAVDEPADAIGVTEQFDGFGDSAATQQAADATGGDHFGAIVGGGCDVAGDACVLAELLQGIDVSGAIVAEVEIGTFHDTAGLKSGLNDL